MKLRNKKTGRILEAEKILFGNGRIGDGLEWNTYQPAVSSLAELNEEWEDYTPAEPLIKDEKIRKAVRAWADANNIDPKHYYHCMVKFDRSEHRLTWIRTSIEFDSIGGLENLDDEKEYTIAELCGEEEEYYD